MITSKIILGICSAFCCFTYLYLLILAFIKESNYSKKEKFYMKVNMLIILLSGIFVLLFTFL